MIALVNARAPYFGHSSLFLDYVDIVDDNDDGYRIFARVTINTLPKPETAHEKSLPPRVESSKIKKQKLVIIVNLRRIVRNLPHRYQQENMLFHSVQLLLLDLEQMKTVLSSLML